MRQARGRNSKPKKTQETIRLPLRSYSWLEARGGTVVKTLQLIGRGGDRGRPGEIVIGVVSDMKNLFTESRRLSASGGGPRRSSQLTLKIPQR